MARNDLGGTIPGLGLGLIFPPFVLRPLTFHHSECVRPAMQGGTPRPPPPANLLSIQKGMPRMQFAFQEWDKAFTLKSRLMLILSSGCLRPSCLLLLSFAVDLLYPSCTILSFGGRVGCFFFVWESVAEWWTMACRSPLTHHQSHRYG